MELNRFDLSNFEEYRKANPFQDLCNADIEEVSVERCVLTAQVKPEFLNLNGCVHGGYLYALIDIVGGITARASGRNCVVASANVHFLRAAKAQRLRAVGELVKGGRSMALVHVTVSGEEGSVYAVGDAEMFYLGEKEV